MRMTPTQWKQHRLLDTHRQRTSRQLWPSMRFINWWSWCWRIVKLLIPSIQRRKWSTVTHVSKGGNINPCMISCVVLAMLRIDTKDLLSKKSRISFLSQGSWHRTTPSSILVSSLIYMVSSSNSSLMWIVTTQDSSRKVWTLIREPNFYFRNINQVIMSSH